jgi:hypothetical protein
MYNAPRHALEPVLVLAQKTTTVSVVNLMLVFTNTQNLSAKLLLRTIIEELLLIPIPTRENFND